MGRPKKKRTDADRRRRQAARLADALKIIGWLQGRGRWNAKRLAKELECSERTVFRYLNILGFAGVPYYYDDSSDSYRLGPGFPFRLTNLTDEETLGQAVAVAVTKAAGLDISLGARPTADKLLATLPDHQRRVLEESLGLIHVLDLKLADHSHRAEVIRAVQWALIEHRQLQGEYVSPYKDAPLELRLHPYRLCLLRQAWYLIARPSDRRSPRTYRIHRFNTIRMLDDAAEHVSDFDLRSYFGDAWCVYKGRETHEVEVLFASEAAAVVTETIWHHTQKVDRRPDGAVTLSFRVDGLDEILWWILGWSGRAKVLKPPELRNRILRQLRLAIKMNETRQ